MSTFTPTRMDSTVKAAWVAKLRDPKMSQTKGVLHRTDDDNGDSFCCLGVLCTLALSDEITIAHDADYDGEVGYGHEEKSTALPPKEVAEWAGFAVDGVGFQIKDAQIPMTDALADDQRLAESGLKHIPYTSLATLNDAGFTFAEIADLIDEHL